MDIFFEHFLLFISQKKIILLFILSFLIGSIPFGLLVVKYSGYGDIRKIGSGNIGATNVLRTGNKFLALLTLILDFSKSFFILYFAKIYYHNLIQSELLLSLFISLGLFSLLGHMFSPFLYFKGGKGIATTAGILLFLSWPCALLTALAWISVVIAFKTSSLGALLASLLAPILFWSIKEMVNADILTDSLKISEIEIYFLLIIVVLIWIKHIPNILRIINGTESKL